MRNVLCSVFLATSKTDTYSKKRYVMSSNISFLPNFGNSWIEQVHNLRWHRIWQDRFMGGVRGHKYSAVPKWTWHEFSLEHPFKCTICQRQSRRHFQKAENWLAYQLAKKTPKKSFFLKPRRRQFNHLFCLFYISTTDSYAIIYGWYRTRIILDVSITLQTVPERETRLSINQKWSNFFLSCLLA